MRCGTGRRQQQILQLLADGAPRDCGAIGEDIKLSPDRVHTTIATMRERGWVGQVGRARHWQAQVWRITTAGRRQIPPQCSK
ncbi:hypothetical protein [Nocardia sp. BMG51109]|uniref:hypothetical protein n=1 Tax=Nocardia sp. BMG51109 TaxID=1056816 RepID=UPI000466AA4A|nr:hypothetical protein [Nocardia sp. BMG51109]